jgi:hypothetical protein
MLIASKVSHTTAAMFTGSAKRPRLNRPAGTQRPLSLAYSAAAQTSQKVMQ